MQDIFQFCVNKNESPTFAKIFFFIEYKLGFLLLSSTGTGNKVQYL